MRRAEIRWCRFSHPDKRRPVVILSRQATLESLGEVIVAPITTTIRGIRSEVLLTVDDGMPKTCAANLDHVGTVSKAFVGPLIATLGERKMDEIRDALLFAVGFESR